MTAQLLTTKQFAEAMQISEWAVRRLCRQKRVKARNVGTEKRAIYRIPASELDVA